MNRIPIHTHGHLTHDGSSWVVRLDNASDLFEEGIKVTLVVWSDSDEGNESEVERIARVQQLPVEVVARALASEGVLIKI